VALRLKAIDERRLFSVLDGFEGVPEPNPRALGLTPRPQRETGEIVFCSLTGLLRPLKVEATTMVRGSDEKVCLRNRQEVQIRAGTVL
jgi:hypothetical protein